MLINELVNKYLKQWIRSQWLNFRRALIEPQAREELLSGGKLYFYEKHSSTPKHVFIDEDCEIPQMNPVIADYNGDFPDIFFEPDQEDKYTVLLRDANEVSLVQVDLEKEDEI